MQCSAVPAAAAAGLVSTYNCLLFLLDRRKPPRNMFVLEFNDHWHLSFFFLKSRGNKAILSSAPGKRGEQISNLWEFLVV